MVVTGQKRHPFVCTDPTGQRILWFDAEGRLVREKTGVSGCFDLWSLPGSRLLYSHFGGAEGDGVSLDDAQGRTVFTYRTRREVFGCQPLADGSILTGELFYKRMCVVSPEGRVVREIPVEYEGVPHECMRLPRRVKDGFLAVQPGQCRIAKFGPDGRPVRYYATRHDTFGVLETERGGLLYTCMEGAFELDADGREIWQLTAGDVPDIGIRWLLGVERLHDGNLVFTNWMGHGHRDEGIPFFEVTPEKRVVWSCDTRGTALEPACLQLLDEDAAEVCFTPLK